MKILQITPFFSPNIGGVETHLIDLVTELSKKKFYSDVLTYQPVMSNEKASSSEYIGDYVYVRRLEILRNLFIKVEPYPILDFFLLTPVLLTYSVYYLMKNHKKIDVIHSHGLNAGFIGCFLKFIFRKPLIISTHVTYSLNKSILSYLVYNIFNFSNHILTLSNASKNELIKLGINKNKIDVYKYWVDQDLFKLRNKAALRKAYSFKKDVFLVLFVGRLIEKKGLLPLIEGFKNIRNSNIKLLIAGTGPLENFVKKSSNENQNIVYLGGLKSNLLKDYYSLSDTLIIPSTHDEGFGRVILEAVSCGLPIIASDRGGIPEAVNDEVSILFNVSPEKVKDSILLMQKRIAKIGVDKISKVCREFAEKNYSCDNINTFIKIYEKVIR